MTHPSDQFTGFFGQYPPLLHAAFQDERNAR